MARVSDRKGVYMVNEELQLDDVYDIWLTPFWQTPAGYAILLVLALILLFMFYGFWSWLRARRGSVKERSLRALQALAGKVQHNQLDTRRVYHELTTTIKSYAQWRYGLPYGMTDYELTTLLESSDLDKQYQEKIQRIIADAQTVKFGKADVLKSQILDDIDAAAGFIEATQKTA